MTEFFFHIYQLCHPTHPQGWATRLRIYSLMRFVVRLLANIILPVWYVVSRKDSYVTDPNSIFVVSLTSFPQRIGKAWLSVESILRQTYRPQRITLWLSKEQFPHEMDDIPSNLRSQCRRGLEIIFCEGDIRSHKKYCYLLRQAPSCNMVTIDDDIFYSENLLKTLFEQHKIHPEDVIAAYVHQMTFDENHKLNPYSAWNHHTTSDKDLFFGSGGGTCFPAGVFYKDVCDIDRAFALCPTADDIWLNAQVRLSNHQIRRVPLAKPYHFVEIMRLKDIYLSDENVYHEHRNDDQIAAVEQAYASVMNPIFRPER